MTDTAELQEPVDMRLSLARSLVDSLEKGDESASDKIISNLIDQHESMLFQEIGRLTRQLHDAMYAFRDDKRISELAEARIPDARERLSFVIEKTEQSAHKTLNAIDEALPIASELAIKGAQAHADWSRFIRREMDVTEFKEMSKHIESFLEMVEEDAQFLNKRLSDIMMAQDFQDQTGQIIRQVITLVQDMEESLVAVIKRTSHAQGYTEKKSGESKTGIAAEGPQINSEDNPNVMSGQDEVDDLLSSLGF
ncbi:MAG: protein phosphatase CheZ [Gammaproteobacteria bacterium]